MVGVGVRVVEVWGGEGKRDRQEQKNSAPLGLLWHSDTTWWGGECLYLVGVEAQAPYSAFSGTTPLSVWGSLMRVKVWVSTWPFLVWVGLQGFFFLSLMFGCSRMVIA